MTFTFICHPGKTHDHRSRIPESIWTQGHKSIWTQGHKRKDRSLLRAHTAKSPELEPPKGKGLSAGGELGHQSGVNKRWRREYRRLRRRRLSESRENQWSRHRLLDPAPTPLARTLKLSNKMTVTFTLRYKLAAFGAGEEDIKRDRKRHPIYEVAGSTTLDGWMQSIPRDGEEDGGVYGVYTGALGKACKMAFVLCGEDIAGLSIGENCGIKAAVWERFLNTVAAIHGGDDAKLITLGGLLEDMEAKLAQATPEQRELFSRCAKRTLRYPTRSPSCQLHRRWAPRRQTSSCMHRRWPIGRAMTSTPLDGCAP